MTGIRSRPWNIAQPSTLLEAADRSQPMHRGLFAPILWVKAKKHPQGKFQGKFEE